jgi:hypothetical protein
MKQNEEGRNAQQDVKGGRKDLQKWRRLSTC